LLRGLVRLARQEFGVLGPTVFREWGVLTGEDVGRIVFRLVDCGELSARPEDTLEDFRDFDLFGGLTAGLEIGSQRVLRERRPRPRHTAGESGTAH
jgi:uncharacterized repeat protein (TIGR04138 family)